MSMIMMAMTMFAVKMTLTTAVTMTGVMTMITKIFMTTLMTMLPDNDDSDKQIG